MGRSDKLAPPLRQRIRRLPLLQPLLDRVAAEQQQQQPTLPALLTSRAGGGAGRDAAGGGHATRLLLLLLDLKPNTGRNLVPGPWESGSPVPPAVLQLVWRPYCQHLVTKQEDEQLGTAEGGPAALAAALSEALAAAPSAAHVMHLAFGPGE